MFAYSFKRCVVELFSPKPEIEKTRLILFRVIPENREISRFDNFLFWLQFKYYDGLFILMNSLKIVQSSFQGYFYFEILHLLHIPEKFF